MADELINIEVAYATPERQVVIPLDVPTGSTVEGAIATSGILREFREINLNTQKVGIFGQVCTLDKTLTDGDRIEIYRPLMQNPMDARRGRLQK